MRAMKLEPAISPPLVGGARGGGGAPGRAWRLCLPAATWLALLVACDGDVPGHRDFCSGPGGAFVECELAPVETVEDACFRLVECGVIPLVDEDGFAWDDCVRNTEELSSDRRRFVLECVDASTCDDLQPGDQGRIPCFVF